MLVLNFKHKHSHSGATDIFKVNNVTKSLKIKGLRAQSKLKFKGELCPAILPEVQMMVVVISCSRTLMEQPGIGLPVC